MPRVLLVEDEAIPAMALRLMLEARGYTVVGVAVSGREAVDLAGGLQPDIMLVDIRLRGGMSGMDAVREIQARRPLPVIFTSAYSVEEIRASGTVEADCLCVTKPIRESELIQAMESLLGHAGDAGRGDGT